MMLASIEVKEAKATTINVTRTFSSLSYDGMLYYEYADYTVAYNSPVAQGIKNTTTSEGIGQVLRPVGPGLYCIYRTFLFFDTSIIPDNATLINATLSLYVKNNYSDEDFNVTLQHGWYSQNPNQPPNMLNPHIPLITEDYSRTNYYSFSHSSKNTSTITGLGYWNIPITGIDVINILTEGITKLCLRSNREMSGTVPTGNEYINIYFCEQSEAYAPKLYVTYQTEGVLYVVHGPYYEDGTNATALITCVLTQPHNSSITFSLNGTDGKADTVNIAVEQPATYLAWNISASTNCTRIYYFLNVTFDEVWVFMPKPSEPCYPYEFGITDFCGMQNPYLETIINVGGNSRIVERKKLDVPTITFFMIQWHHYDLRFRCDQGVYTQGFSAETTWLTNIPILSGAFPTTPYTYPTVTVTRTSGSVITIAYADPTESTVWVYFKIYHYVNQAGVEDYTWNTTGNSVTFPWSEADNTTNYYVYTEAYADSTLWSWVLPALATSFAVNPWTGIIGPSFGTLPLINIDFSQVIAAGIILCVLGIFSYASAGVGCILSLLVAGIFVVLGWYVMSLPMFVFGAFVAIFVMVEEAKRTEREI